MADGKLAYEITADASRLVSEIGRGMAALGSMTAKITALGSAAGLGAAGVGLGIGVKVAADREQVRIAFNNIIGDARQADTVLKGLFKFANVTPFESDEVIGAARKLLAAGVATKDLQTELTALGNVAAGVGTDLGGLATIYSQISDKGKVMAEELMQFGERGAGAIKDQLARSLNVTKAELMEMTSQGLVSFDQFRNALQQLAGPTGRWGNLMAQQAQSTLGLWSSLKDAVNEVFNALGQPINDAIKPVLNDAIGLAENLKPAVGEIGTAVGEMVKAMRDFTAEAGKGGGMAKSLAAAVGAALQSVWPYIEGIAGAMGQIGAALGSALMTAIEPIGNAMLHTLEAAGYAFQALLLEALSKLPGLSGLNMDAQKAASSGRGKLASAQMDMIQGEGAGGKAMDQIAAGMERAKAAFNAPIDKAKERATNEEKGKQWLSEQSKAKQDFDLAMRVDKLKKQNVSDPLAVARKEMGLDPVAASAKETATAVKELGTAVKSTTAAVKPSGSGPVGADNRAAMRAADLSAAGRGGSAMIEAKTGGIHGYSAKREAAGEYAAKRWQRLNEGEKGRYGGDFNTWATRTNGGLGAMGARQMRGGVLSRANEALTGTSGPAPKTRPRDEAPPKAQTQDATNRGLFQAILQELKQMNTHLGSVVKG